MDFQKVKEEALKLKKKASAIGKQAVVFGTAKLADSKYFLKNTKELEACIETSKNTTHKDPETAKEKTFIHQSVIIFCDTKSDFFESLLLGFPVLATKAFSQNITIRLAGSDIEGFKNEDYKIHSFPVLVLFEDAKVKKVIEGEELIQKVVKNMSLDINKVINEL